MQQTERAADSTPPGEADAQDERVVVFVPRGKPAPQRAPDPVDDDDDDDDDDDPGPTAA
jgi:hypothetical protein